jgi:hypothetical protein
LAAAELATDATACVTAALIFPPLSAVFMTTLPIKAFVAALTVTPAAEVSALPIAVPMPGNAMTAIDAALLRKSPKPAPRVSSSAS